MNAQAPLPTFRSHRMAPAPEAEGVENVGMEAAPETPRAAIAPAAKPEEGARASILVASLNNGMNQMVSAALSAEDGASVAALRASLADLAALEPDFVNGHDVVVFQADPADAAEMAALAAVTARRGGQTRFLAMTSEGLRLADAKALMEAGVDEVLPLASIRPDLRHAVDLSAETAERPRGGGRASARPGDVIAVAQACGGIGATTLAVNLAAALAAPKMARRGEAAQAPRVALIDLDFQHGNAGFFLDVEDRGAFMSMARDGTEPDATFLSTAMIAHPSGLHVLPAPAEFAPLTALTPPMILALLQTLRAEYDFVVVDMPAALVDWLAPVLAEARRMLLVTDTSVPAIRQARRLMDFYLDENPGLEIEIVVNRAKKPFSLSASQKEAQLVLDRPLATWIPRDDRAVRSAMDAGQPVVSAARRSPVARAVSALARKIEAARAAEAQARTA